MGQAENYVEQYLVDTAEAKGMFVRKLVSPGRNGFPDRLIIHRGRSVYVELKSATGRLSAIQRKTISQMADHGAEVCCVCSRLEVDALLAAISTRTPQLPYRLGTDIWP